MEPPPVLRLRLLGSILQPLSPLLWKYHLIFLRYSYIMKSREIPIPHALRR